MSDYDTRDYDTRDYDTRDYDTQSDDQTPSPFYLPHHGNSFDNIDDVDSSSYHTSDSPGHSSSKQNFIQRQKANLTTAATNILKTAGETTGSYVIGEQIRLCPKI